MGWLGGNRVPLVPDVSAVANKDQRRGLQTEPPFPGRDGEEEEKTLLTVLVPSRACHHPAHYCVARYSDSDLKVGPSASGLVCSGGIRSARFLLRLG